VLESHFRNIQGRVTRWRWLSKFLRNDGVDLRYKIGQWESRALHQLSSGGPAIIPVHIDIIQILTSSC
jgi:hypothetical protein